RRQPGRQRAHQRGAARGVDALPRPRAAGGRLREPVQRTERTVTTGAGPRLRDLPSVERLATDPRLSGYAAAAVRLACRDVIAEERAARRAGGSRHPDLGAAAAGWLEQRLAGAPRRVINATGVWVHPNLGR